MEKERAEDDENLSISRALLQNDDPQTKDGLGILYLSTGRPTKAEALFMEALRILPNDPIVQVHLVSLEFESDRRKLLNLLSLSLFSFPNPTNHATTFLSCEM